MEQEENKKLQLAFDFVQFTGENIFLTGKAGTGKTTFLKMLKARTPKRMIVVAPTGVAAVNAGGVTIHSFFQIPFGPYIPNPGETGQESPKLRFSKIKIQIMRSIDLLVIDEISMVRCDLLDAVDEVLRRFKNRNKPFGGVQLLMIGDLQQLAPVVKESERELLSMHYETFFFFGSKALRSTRYICIELTHIYRQKDRLFIDLLNKIAANQMDDYVLEELNKRYVQDYARYIDKGYIFLTTHNYQQIEINTTKLEQLAGKKYVFKAKVEGDFPDYAYPAEYELVLKEGAQVMFSKNDASPEKLYFNGKIGTVLYIEDDVVYVKCPGHPFNIAVTPVEWTNTRYTLDEQTREISEEVVGTFTQYPLKLAWAITIHKSQGLTFENAVIDVRQAFAHGQVYVALSRCRTLEGLILSSPINGRCIRNDMSVAHYIESISRNEPDARYLSHARQMFLRSLLLDLFDFKTLSSRLGYLRKLTTEHKSILHPAFFDGVIKAADAAESALFAVGNRFLSQLNNLFEHSDEAALITRLASAGKYFREKNEEIILTFFSEQSIDTDNRSVRKSISESIERVMEEAILKNAGFEVCEKGFNLKNFLEARARAGLEEFVLPKPKNRKTVNYDEAAKDTEIYARLKEWRSNRAREMDVAPYLILHNKVLILLSLHLPKTLQELEMIKGLGKRKINQYGNELLAVIHEYSTSK